MSTSIEWPAPTAEGPLSATVQVPGSKSLTNRTLVLAALAGTATSIRRPLHARDTMLMASALRSLGIAGHDIDDPTGGAPGWWVDPRPMLGPATIDCGLAGTVMRFVPPLAALADGPVAFDGDPRARERPMAPILQALRSLGVHVEAGGRGDRLPFAILGQGRVAGGSVTIDASASSQFVSALLLAGARYDHGIEVTSTTPVPSLPHVSMTVELLRRSGIDARQSGPRTWTVAPGVPVIGDITIEPDLSNAMPFLAAALVLGGSVTIPGWPADSLQPDAAVRGLLDQLGADLHDTAEGLRVTGTGVLPGLDIDMSEIGELVPTLAALAALATSPTRIRGVAHLRGHETDRLAALATEISAIGGQATETSDGLQITPAPLTAGTWHTYDDHRMATAGAILGLKVPGLLIENIATTDKTLPGFVEMWQTMLAGDRS